MNVTSLPIDDVKLLTPRIFADSRGEFCETWSTRAFETAGLSATFVQDNQSLSREVGTIRGLHFQLAPAAQGKLVRVVAGAVLDVAVDLRRSSPTFGQHVSAELSARNWAQIWIPEGFAHGFCTLEPDTIVAYKVTSGYAPALDRGLAFDDPDLAIAWPVAPAAAMLSDRDRRHPRLRDLGPVFA